MKNFLIVLLILIVITPIKAQSSENKLTGNLNIDSKILFNKNDLQSPPQIIFQTENKKKPILAGLFSLVVPGSGEVYSGDYLKAAIFVVLEAAVITTGLIYDNKGDKKTDEFQHYADENWSVVRYAEWLNQYEGTNISINSNTSLPPWERVNWSELNNAEKGSHKLPPYGTQQYYELIGKYNQYSGGWNDYSSGENNSQISPNYSYYSGERGKANDYYNVAAKAVIGIYINHFLSALDAVWTTINYNKSLAVKMRVEEINFADRMELVPTLKLSFSF